MTAVDALSESNQFPVWVEENPEKIARRKSLSGDKSVDVTIVGGGYSGLWTAYYLLKNCPTLRVIIIEKQYCGFGASGRNGGWCKGSVAGSPHRYAKYSSPELVNKLQRAMFDAVDEVGHVVKKESINCGFNKNGLVRLARNKPQAQRQFDEVKRAKSMGLEPEIIDLLGKDEARTMLNATDIESAIFFSPAATLNPLRLVQGLASAVERLGGQIAEATEVTEIKGTRITTTHGSVDSEIVVLATEAYTRNLKGKKRDYIPAYSRMIATEPLSEELLEEMKLNAGMAFSDDRYSVIYGTLTEDNRVAFGGRGTPIYQFGSKISPDAESDEKSHLNVYHTLVNLLPQLEGTAVTHRWGGVLAIPRNWLPGLRFDRDTSTGVLGGYVGSGVASANLAGRTMADLILNRKTSRTLLPWVGKQSKKWEPEPLRSIGVLSSGSLLKFADTFETMTGRTAKTANLVAKLIRGS